MTIALRAAGASAAGTTTVVVAQPTGTAIGDTLVAFILDHATTGSTTAPTGWTRQGGAATASGRFQVFTAVVGEAGLTGTSWTWSSLTTRSQGVIVGYTGVDTTTPVDVAASAQINASGTTGTTSITTATANAKVIGGFAALASGATWSAETTATAGSLTEEFDAANSTFCSIAVADVTLAAAGATGASSATMSANGVNGGILIALRPATIWKVGDTTQGTPSTSKVTSATVAVTMTSTANTLILTSSTWTQSTNNNPATIAISGLGATWTLAARNTQADGAVSIWLATGATSTSGNLTLTYTNTGNTGAFYAVEVVEFSGQLTQDGSAVTWTGTANQAITLGSPGDLVVKACDTALDVTSFTYTSPTTPIVSLTGKVDSATNVALAAGYSLASASGSWSSGAPAGTTSASDIWCMAAFKIASGGGAQTVSPTAIASAEALGSATVTPGGVTVSPSGVTSGGAFGSATVTPGPVSITPTGIASSEALGTATVSLGPVTVSPGGISTGETFGAATVSPGPVTISPVGIATGETFGTAVVAPGPVTVSPGGIASGQAFGAATVTPGPVTVTPTAIATGEIFGTAAVTPGPVTVSPTGIGTAETFGTAVVSAGGSILSPTGIASSEAFGTAVLTPGPVTVSPVGVTSGGAFGAATVTPGPVVITLSAITSAEAFGSPSITVAGQVITIPGYSSMTVGITAATDTKSATTTGTSAAPSATSGTALTLSTISASAIEGTES